jgi:alpha-glucosidase
VAYAKLTNALLLCLRGNPILYQGEELGLTQAEIAFEDLQDPEAIANWPLTLGRDGARTPMPWINDNSYAGFSEVKPWLPVGEGHAHQAAAAQYGQPFSVLEFTRAVISLRNGMEAFRIGEVNFPDAPAPLLVMERSSGGVRVLCLFNLGEAPQEVSAALTADAKTLLASDGDLTVPQSLAPFGVWIGTRGA